MSKTQHALENLHEHNSQGCGHDHHHEDESGHNDNSACGYFNLVQCWGDVTRESLI